MFRRPEPQNTASPSWWIRLCQWLWSQRRFIWGTLIAGIFVSVAACSFTGCISNSNLAFNLMPRTRFFV